MKILLLHGWGYKSYKNPKNENEHNPWHNRVKFIDQLKALNYDLITPSFPGFIGSKDDQVKPWDEKEYVDFCQKIVHAEKPDAILGYSFGGAVALMWKNRVEQTDKTKLILVSPALERSYKEKTMPSNIKGMVPKFLVNFLRDFYLKYVIRNPFYKYGNNFLKQTYLNIVKIKCGRYLEKINPAEILLIFGEKDTITPPTIIQSMFNTNPRILKRIKIINDGGHDIANTHTNELVEHIKTYLDETDA